GCGRQGHGPRCQRSSQPKIEVNPNALAAVKPWPGVNPFRMAKALNAALLNGMTLIGVVVEGGFRNDGLTGVREVNALNAMTLTGVDDEGGVRNDGTVGGRVANAITLTGVVDEGGVKN